MLIVNEKSIFLNCCFHDYARRAILEQTVTGLSGIVNTLNNQNQTQGKLTKFTKS